MKTKVLCQGQNALQKDLTYLLTYLLLASTVTAFYACKEERNLPMEQRQDNYVQVTAADAQLVQKQLAWIAKGLAGIADQNPSVKAGIHDFILSSNYFTQSNLDIDDELQNTTGFDYDQEVDQWLQTNQPGNDYDQSYFFEIDTDSCPGDVVVRIPEADIADESKLHVVTPENVFGHSENTWGYYLSAIGAIDSINITDENADSVYLWVIGLTDCNDGSTAIIVNPERGCDFDSICEPWFGEKWPDCAPCVEPLPNEMSLTLKSLHFNADHKRDWGGHPGRRYQEAQLQGKYNIRFGYAVFNGIPKINRIANFGSPLSDLSFNEKGYTSWGKDCDIKRKNIRRGTSNRGRIWIDEVNVPLTQRYNSTEDTLSFTLYERDKDISFQQFLANGGIHSNGSAYSNSGGTAFTFLLPNALPVNSPSYTGDWILVSPGVWEANFPLDTEMNATFQLTSN